MNKKPLVSDAHWQTHHHPKIRPSTPEPEFSKDSKNGEILIILVVFLGTF
jgi:hypothetical protein